MRLGATGALSSRLSRASRSQAAETARSWGGRWGSMQGGDHAALCSVSDLGTAPVFTQTLRAPALHRYHQSTISSLF